MRTPAKDARLQTGSDPNYSLLRVNGARAVDPHANFQDITPTIEMAGWGI
jgi:hypothetical protein